MGFKLHPGAFSFRVHIFCAVFVRAHMWQAPSNGLGKPGCIREHKAVEEEANNLAEWVPEVALSRLWGCRIRSGPANSPLLPSHEFS